MTWAFHTNLTISYLTSFLFFSNTPAYFNPDLSLPMEDLHFAIRSPSEGFLLLLAVQSYQNDLLGLSNWLHMHLPVAADPAISPSARVSQGAVSLCRGASGVCLWSVPPHPSNCPCCNQESIADIRLCQACFFSLPLGVSPLS